MVSVPSLPSSTPHTGALLAQMHVAIGYFPLGALLGVSLGAFLVNYASANFRYGRRCKTRNLVTIPGLGENNGDTINILCSAIVALQQHSHDIQSYRQHDELAILK